MDGWMDYSISGVCSVQKGEQNGSYGQYDGLWCLDKMTTGYSLECQISDYYEQVLYIYIYSSIESLFLSAQIYTLHDNKSSMHIYNRTFYSPRSFN